VRLLSAGRIEATGDTVTLSGAAEFHIAIGEPGSPAPAGLTRPLRSGHVAPDPERAPRVAGFALPDGLVVEVEARVGDGPWRPAGVGVGTPTLSPADVRNPVHTLPMRRDGDLYSLPAEVLGRVVVECDRRPRLFAGESIQEATAARGAEQHHDVRRRTDGRWESVHELGLRYLTVHDAAATAVVAEARAFPIARRGAFACSDEVLTDIWIGSAYTLRQCTHGLILDGIKRDRMPWMGDLAVSVPASAYAFPDADVAERGLVALGQNPTGYINGILDYSLWWLICTAEYARYFDAHAYLVANADHINAVVRALAAEAGDDGVLRPHPGPDAYDKPVFIDWGVDVDPNRDATSLQALWFWALTSAHVVLTRAGHPGADEWARLADRLRRTLDDRAWDAATNRWREYLDDEADSPYPAVFALLAGLTTREDAVDLGDWLLAAPETRTPFVTTFAVRALAESGQAEAAVAQIRRRWGRMLELGATTFWEEFPEDGEVPYEMYGREFGKSLCHAWAAGPAQLLPEIICGLRPAGDAWSTFEVNPSLGALEWAGASVPVPDGEISVLVTPIQTTVEIPAGHALLRDGVTHHGPATFSFRTAPSETARTDAAADPAGCQAEAR
jgi:hypothetical protein